MAPRMRNVARLLCLAGALLLSGVARAQTSGGSDKATEDELFGKPTADSKPADKAGAASQTSAAAPASQNSTTTTAAQASDAKKTEDDLFGGNSSSTTSAPSSTTSAPGAADGKSSEAEDLTPTSMDALIAKTDAANDKLAIGGVAYLRTEYDQRTSATSFAGSLLQPRNSLQSPNTFDIYLDARPNDRVRFYLRGRLLYNASLQNNLNGQTTSAADQVTTLGTIGAQSGCITQVLCPLLDQAWVKFDLGQKVFFTIGRQRIKWGSGHFWNPTDFMNPVKLNALAIFDPRLGVDLIKIHFPIESKQWNFYVLANLQDTSQPTNIGVGARAEFLVGQTELTTSAAWRPQSPFKIGADISSGVGPFDLHAEAALLHPNGYNEATTLTGTLGPGFYDPSLINQVTDPSQLAGLFGSVTQNQHLHEWLPQVVAGGEVSIPYTDQDSLTLGAEYFYNSLGYSNNNLYPLLFSSGFFQPLYTGQHYAAFYAALPNPGDWNNTSFTLSTIGNLSDLSFVSRLDYNIKILTYLTVFAYGQVSYGEPGELHYGLNIKGLGTEVQGLPLVNGVDPSKFLQYGMQIGAPLYSVGAGLMLNI